VDEQGLAFSSTSTDDEARVVDLLLDGRRIWSFKVVDTIPVADGPAGLRRIDWPRPLPPYLVGTSDYALRPVDGGPDRPSTRVRLGDSDDPVQFIDRHGIGLVINKFNNIGHALADYDPQTIPRLLDRMDQVRTVIEEAGLPAYVMGGTLLGPYRDGRIMPYDDDADLGYLSWHAHPVDVVREAFALGRRVRAAGLDAVRASAGHLQVHFSHEGRPDAYVDIFTGFVDEEGWFQHTFAVRTKATREQIVPPIIIDVEGRPEPAPRIPEIMLEANYGPGWKVPDPSFRFSIPRSTQDRFWGWFSDYGMDRTVWEDHYRYDVAGGHVGLGTRPSEYAQWLADRLEPGSSIVELGHGWGHDALWLAEQGHRVEAVDYVRWPTKRANDVAAERGLPARFRTLNLNDLRRVIALGAEVAARQEPVVVYARALLATLWEYGQPTLFRLLSMMLRHGGQAHLDVPRESLKPERGTGIPLHRVLDLDALRADMARYGLRIDETHEADEHFEYTPWSTGERPLPTTRMVVSWQRAAR
jgi:hypothetical protein